jgi:hypothetical protein
VDCGPTRHPANRSRCPGIYHIHYAYFSWHSRPDATSWKFGVIRQFSVLFLIVYDINIELMAGVRSFSLVRISGSIVPIARLELVIQSHARLGWDSHTCFVRFFHFEIAPRFKPCWKGARPIMSSTRILATYSRWRYLI